MSHPVDELAEIEFETAAANAASMLAEFGYAWIDLQPGDATTYKIVIAQPREPGEVGFKLLNGEPVHGWARVNRYWVGTSFGPLYPTPLKGGYQWGYVLDHFVHGDGGTSEWTARVITRFLNALSDKLKEG